jgi:hypothetical protein
LSRQAIEQVAFQLEEKRPELVLPVVVGTANMNIKSMMNIVLRQVTKDREDRLTFAAWLFGYDAIESTNNLKMSQALAIWMSDDMIPDLYQEYERERQQSLP